MHGEAVLPETAPTGPAARMTVEVHDVTLADAPSAVVARTVLERVPLAPNRVIEFDLDVPEASPGRDLSLRVHVDVDGTGVVTPGDLITTQHLPVAGVGELAGVVAPLRRI
ncbi:YbaY family lipoprotein [Jiangella asiatica]|nr:YbaY family lipoprotein [Jiangella asiatica]